MGLFSRNLILAFLFLHVGISSPELIAPPEICDNGIDDDLDGLIDIQDEDCSCPEWKPVSLTPNPSFELQECCPGEPSAVDCATGWVQASTATPDYFHACNYSGSDIFDLPQPLPDGDGFVGFIDGVFTNGVNPFWKEYIGTCLTSPLQVDSVYQLEFHIGFVDRNTSPDIDIAIFGSTDCANIPFGNGDARFGCPSRSSQWVRLGGVSAVGHNEWKKYQIVFKALSPFTTIVIGPDCNPRSATNNPYHFLDQVILAKLTDFEVDIKSYNDPCAVDFSLGVRPQPNTQYQWYQDGVAIIGANESRLNNLPGRGEYTVQLQNEEGCKLAAPYGHFPPVDFKQISRSICQGETLEWNDQQLFEKGVYFDTLKTQNNCDSIIRMELDILESIEVELTKQIIQGQSFQIGDTNYDAPGNYSKTLPSSLGCDSTINFQLSFYPLFIPNAFSPNGDNVNDVFSIYGNEDLQNISSFMIFDRWGDLVYQANDILTGEGWNGKVNGKPAAVGVYIYIVGLDVGGDTETQLSGTLTLIR